MINFEILLIDKNKIAESCCLDEPKVKEKVEEFIYNTCWDLDPGLKGSRFFNDFVLALFSYHMLSEEI